jgi:hypothetical protein
MVGGGARVCARRLRVYVHGALAVLARLYFQPIDSNRQKPIDTHCRLTCGTTRTTFADARGAPAGG